MLTIYPENQYPEAVEFCTLFLQDKSRPRYVLGRNEYAISISQFVDLDGFVDDFASESEFLGKPIIKMKELPKESLVVSAVIFVMPVTAMNKLKSHGMRCLDYFQFLKYSGAPLKEIDFLNDCMEDLRRNWDQYVWVHDQLEDETSRGIFKRLLNFRASCDLHYMAGFEHAIDRQYFENFLILEPGEVFVDAGGFDGQTTLDFIKRCPEYRSVHLFEPDPKNVAAARSNLSTHRDIYFYTLGLAEHKNTLRFVSGGGSASKVSKTGDIEIHVDSIDNVIGEPVSMIKMDIEGAEGMALEGAREHIVKDHPKLAICCYHKFDDLWRIPAQILAKRDDYSVRLRHYTNGLHETVFFFMPRK